MRARRQEWESKLPEAIAILKAGGEKMKKKAEAKMHEVREKVGVNVY